MGFPHLIWEKREGTRHRKGKDRTASLGNVNGESGAWPSSPTPEAAYSPVPAPSQASGLGERQRGPRVPPRTPSSDWGAAWIFLRCLLGHLASPKFVCHMALLPPLPS